MAEYENCPVCGKALPENLEANFCPFCGVKIYPKVSRETPPLLEEKLREAASLELPDAEVAPDHEREGIAWENGEGLSFLQRLSQTWSDTLFRAADFFRNMPTAGGIGAPFLYGMLLGMIGQVFSIYWRMDQVEELQQNMSDLPGPLQDFFRMALENPLITSPEGQILFAPVAVLFGLFFFTIVFHASYSLLGAAGNGFETTFRVVAYASSTAVFQIIPYLGGYISLILWVYVILVGMREGHEIPQSRAMAGFLLPMAFFCCLAAMSSFMLSSMLVQGG